MTTFFEPINVSAVHIYHSALELSPRSSIVRRLYYHRRHNPFPRVVAGTQDSWDQSSTIRHGGNSGCSLFTWSPCGLHVAINRRGVTEIRDPLTSELLSTLRPTKPTNEPICALAYSPDGRSLAASSATSFIIWDIQTGGVAREVEWGAEVEHDVAIKVLLVWSLDGRAIAICTAPLDNISDSVHVYDVDSGVARFHSTIQSSTIRHFWAHNESFRIMMAEWDSEAGRLIVDLFDAGSVLTKIESFRIGPFGPLDVHKDTVSFSPTTYRIAASSPDQVYIFDIRNWEFLLDRFAFAESHCFSSDGSLYAYWDSSSCHIKIWKYSSGHYTMWGEFPTQNICDSLRFSPDSSLLAGWFPDFLRVWRLDRPPVTHPINYTLCALSHCGTYVATGHFGSSTVAITRLPSRSPPQFIDAGYIVGLALTGNVLLVEDVEEIKAWLLTEVGVVDGPLGDRRAGHCDSIWTIPKRGNPVLLFRDQTVTMVQDGCVTLVYHTGTGEVLTSTQATPHPRDRQCSLRGMGDGLHYLHRRDLGVPSTHSETDWPVSWTSLEEGWVKGPEGRRRLWIPPAWRSHPGQGGWHCNITTLWLGTRGRTVIVMF